MEDILKENWLQIADHIATIVFGALTFILTIIVIHLELRDRTKRIAIKELQSQTKELRNLYVLSVQPRFVVSTKPGLFVFKNIGGDCFDIVIKPNNEKFNSFPKSMAASTIFNTDVGVSGIYEFNFKDVLGNKYKQKFNASIRQVSNLEQIKATD